MWVALAAAVLVWPVQASAKAQAKDYAGADGGWLVYAVGSIKFGLDFSFSYAPLAGTAAAADKAWEGRIEPRLGGAIYLKVKNPDFQGDESGHVVVRRLPPGRYSVTRFDFAGGIGGTAYYWSPAKPFALPFEIRPGEATYIGSFMRAASLGTPLRAKLGAAGVFVVADRSARDLPLAAARLPAGTRITAEVTDVTAFGSEALRTEQP